MLIAYAVSIASAGSKRSLAAFLEDSAPKDSLDTSQLAKVLTLHPKYFPEELYTSQEKRYPSLPFLDFASTGALKCITCIIFESTNFCGLKHEFLYFKM